ncbi:plasmid encoded RepA protein (plasmid) [Fibrisoma limi BUZ 3]|uniref:Plasmid encoded RepA protein n=1 Tax=Fibrisoma limi BUZ 3 TaxID=1185876 RepID=I2GU79_9BACT|nr:replication protein RepA [Fibrisoma limi]CCH57680.1 plasmid encoded RepA protein [Fibrisoma limi BUZ 3]
MSDKPNKKPSRYAESRTRLVMESFHTPADEREHLYMPVALAHVYFPRRDAKLGPTESWKHQSGNFSLRIKQVSVENPRTGQDEFLGVPFGPKARLLLGIINTMALQQGSNKIDIEADTLPKFLHKIGLTDGGNQLSQARNQIARLATSIISVSYKQEDGSSLQANLPIVKGFDLFPQAHPNQLLLWKRNIVLSLDYWDELQKHPLPLSLEHLRILSGNARAIDFYSFLAYRLHSLNRPLFLTWATMKEIFGGDIEAMNNFKRKMRETAGLVKLAYRDARFSCDGEGWTFENSPAPIIKKQTLLLP